MVSLSPYSHERQGAGCAPRCSIFRMLVAALLLTCTAWLIKDGLLAPPSVTRRFAKPPTRVVLSLGTVGGRSDYLADSLPSLFNQVTAGCSALFPCRLAARPQRIVLSNSFLNLCFTPICQIQSWKVDLLVITVTKATVRAMLKALEAYGPFEKDDRWALPANATPAAVAAAEGRTIFKGKGGIVLQFLPKDWGKMRGWMFFWLAAATNPIVCLQDPGRSSSEHICLWDRTQTPLLSRCAREMGEL